MNKLSSQLKCKRLRLEYRFLCAETEEIDIILEEAEESLREEFAEELGAVTENQKSKIEEGPPPIMLDEELEDIEKSSGAKNKTMKKLYRKIASLIHPDKNPGEERAKLFQKAVSAYREGDFAELLSVADDVGIEPPSLTTKDIKLLEKSIGNIRSKIKAKKETFGWQWANIEEPAQKENLRKAFYKYHGLDPENFRKD